MNGKKSYSGHDGRAGQMGSGRGEARPLQILVGILIFLCIGFVTSHAGYTQNAPISTAGTVSTYASTVTLQITAVNFNNIGSSNLKLTYDPAIASATQVTTGPLLGGMLSTDLSVPGVISLGWFINPGKTLPDNTVIFNISFSKVNSGTTAVIWDDNLNACRWADGSFVSLNDFPTSTYYINGAVTFQSSDAPLTTISSVSFCPGIFIDIPVTVSAFANIGKFSLNLHYDASLMVFQLVLNPSGFPNFISNGSVPGVVTASGTVAPGNPGINLQNGDTLFTVRFLYLGGTASLEWYDNGTSCQYTGPPPVYTILNDTPQVSYYFNGVVTPLPLPAAAGAITSSSGGFVCPGQTGVVFNVSPVSNATGYIWSLPPGATITNGVNTSSITVDFAFDALSGSVTVYGANDCGDGPVSPAYPLEVLEDPVILFQPLSPPSVIALSGTAGFKVDAAGSALSWQWEEFITAWTAIQDGGVYSGTLTDSLTVTHPTLSMNGNRYRCVVAGACGSHAVTDGMATLAVSPPVGIDGKSGTGKNQLSLTASPNPFSGHTTISYCLPEPGFTRMIVYNLLGEIIMESGERAENKGKHNIVLTEDKFVKGFYCIIIFVNTDGNITLDSIDIICYQGDTN